MSYGTTRISTAAQVILRRLSKAEGKPMLALLDEAVEALRRQRFLLEVNAAYATLRSDSKAWDAVEAERGQWDTTLGDGLIVSERGTSPRPKSRRARARKSR